MHDYQDVSNSHAKDALDKRDAIAGLIDKGIDWTTDPAGIPEDLAKQFVGGLLHTTVDGAIHPETMPPAPAGMDDLSGYATDAVQRWVASQHQGGRAFTPYTDGHKLTWTGDPHFYEPMYGGNFTDHIDPSTEQVDPAWLREHPGAWEAYNAWLLDPAVQQSVFPSFSNEAVGGLRNAGG